MAPARIDLSKADATVTTELQPFVTQTCCKFCGLSPVILPPVHETSSAVHETSITDN